MKWGRVILVIVVAVIITALGIDAADTLSGSRGTLLSQVIGDRAGACPDGMVRVTTVETVMCVDVYEASTGSACPEQEPNSLLSSIRNIDSAGCMAVSKPDVIPWRFVTRDQAMQACARSGKRLPTSREWYALSLGIAGVHESCNVSSRSAARTGTYPACVTPLGVTDMVGNVWEWVSDDVIEGKYREQQLPSEGFVAQVDEGGMATLTIPDAQELFGGDFFWSRTDGSYGIIRGGYFDSGTEAGVYTVHADTLPTTASAGIGFRCVQ